MAIYYSEEQAEWTGTDGKKQTGLNRKLRVNHNCKIFNVPEDRMKLTSSGALSVRLNGCLTFCNKDTEIINNPEFKGSAIFVNQDGEWVSLFDAGKPNREGLDIRNSEPAPAASAMSDQLKALGLI